MLLSSKINNGINGVVNIPGDKSISHRSIIIPSIANGVSEISNLLMSKDVHHTLNAFKNMGVKIDSTKNSTIIYGKGLNSLKKPKNSIYLGNSGTSARLLTGLLASQNFNSTLEGDRSLSKRPMKRITNPLSLMGAKFTNQSGTLPLEIYGQHLKSFQHKIIIPSAQIKSGILFAALNAIGETKIVEENTSRNHTEIMLKSFGANISFNNNASGSSISIVGKKELISKNISIPSDLSSASFFIVAALINKNSKIIIKGININPTRDGILRALKLMGARIDIKNKRLVNEELVGDLYVAYSKLKGCELDPDIAKLMIDEYPILSIAASFAETPSTFKGLKELRVKESDRLELIRANLENCGVYCEADDENLFIDPKRKLELKQNIIKTDYDHRIAMSFAVMGSKLGHDLKIMDEESIETSFPNFVENFNHSGGNLGKDIE